MILPIITYHALGNQRSPVWIDENVFEAQLDAFVRHGYQGLTLAAAIDRFHDGTLPERSVVLTFDDGYESVFSIAWPKLHDRGFPATVFLVSDFCGRDNRWPGQPPSLPVERLLTWEQIQILIADGWEMGAHTLTHPPLSLLRAADIEREILDSRRIIIERIMQPVTSFAYPYGATSPDARSIVRRHYTAAVGTRLGLARPDDDCHELPRLDAHYLHAAYVPYLRTPVVAAYLRGRDGLRRTRRRARPDWDTTLSSQNSIHV